MLCMYPVLANLLCCTTIGGSLMEQGINPEYFVHVVVKFCVFSQKTHFVCAIHVIFHVRSQAQSWIANYMYMILYWFVHMDLRVMPLSIYNMQVEYQNLQESICFNFVSYIIVVKFVLLLILIARKFSV